MFKFPGVNEEDWQYSSTLTTRAAFAATPFWVVSKLFPEHESLSLTW